MTPILLQYDREANAWIAIADIHEGPFVVRVVAMDRDSHEAERKVRRQLAARLS